MSTFLAYSDNEDARYEAAERFVHWMEVAAIREARGDNYQFSNVDPSGRFWLGRLGPKDFVTRQDDRGDRLEPCAIGLRLRPAVNGPWQFSVRVRLCVWLRERSQGGPLRWQWKKSDPIGVVIAANIRDQVGEYILGTDEIARALDLAGAGQLSAELRVGSAVAVGAGL